MSKKVILSSLALCLGMAASSASATLIAYTDRSLWEAAVGGTFIEEDFSGVANAVYEFSPVDVGDFTVSVAGDTFGSTWHNISSTGSGGSSLNSVNGTQQLNLATGDRGGTTLEFDFEIYAFGADWAYPSNDTRVTSFLIGGIQLDIPFLTGGFYGFVSDIALTTNFLTLTAGPADGFGMDNLVYSQVPEPFTLALFGLGLAGIGFSRRKAR